MLWIGQFSSSIDNNFWPSFIFVLSSGYIWLLGLQRRWRRRDLLSEIFVYNRGRRYSSNAELLQLVFVCVCGRLSIIGWSSVAPGSVQSKASKTADKVLNAENLVRLKRLAHRALYEILFSLYDADAVRRWMVHGVGTIRRHDVVQLVVRKYKMWCQRWWGDCLCDSGCAATTTPTTMFFRSLSNFIFNFTQHTECT